MSTEPGELHTLRDGKQILFKHRASGRAASVSADGIRRVRSVVVTLEDLTWVFMRPRLLSGAGITDSVAPLPW